MRVISVTSSIMCMINNSSIHAVQKVTVNHTLRSLAGPTVWEAAKRRAWSMKGMSTTPSQSLRFPSRSTRKSVG